MKKEREYIVPDTPVNVKSLLVNLHEYGQLHPLIQSVQEVDSDLPASRCYQISERPFPFLPINITYTAGVASTATGVEYRIKSIPFADVVIIYDVENLTGGSTRVLFKQAIEGKLIGKRVLAWKMLKAQNTLMENWIKHLEGKD